jgi:oxygen-independent coproporphyrinogen-3 oxidase
MAGIYIHIPFCKQKCHYCNFYSLASNRYFDEVIDAITDEVNLRKSLVSNEIIESVYFGGGTPSLMKAHHLQKIMDAVFTHFSVADHAEITLEANPDDVSQEQLQSFKKNGVNRLSMGVQTFNDVELQYLNRTHDVEKALKSIEMSRREGFENLTIDLIYGLPNSTPASWNKNLHIIKTLGIPHISCYALTVEPNTAFEYFIRKGKLKPPAEELFLDQFEALVDFANNNGYEHYEISNFCKDKRYAQHNTAYWFGKPYLGLGPSAHSYDGISRTWNIAHLKKYIEGIKSENPVFEQEVLTENQRFNEFIMTHLRTQWGVRFSELRSGFSKSQANYFFSKLKKYKDSDLIKISEEKVSLTRKGIFISDSIIADFFVGEE